MKMFSIAFLAAVSVASLGCKKSGADNAKLAELTDKLCACKDKACVDKLSADVDKLKPIGKPDETTGKILNRLMTCMEKLEAASGSAAPAPVAAVPAPAGSAAGSAAASAEGSAPAGADAADEAGTDED
ncbi:MAG: hypothetical protein AB7P03_04940 [Kofleriaceae bacterium]